MYNRVAVNLRDSDLFLDSLEGTDQEMTARETL